MSELRILQVTNGLAVGGSEIVAVRLSNSLARRGHNVSLLVARGGALESQCEVPVIQVRSIYGRFPLPAIMQIRRLIRDLRPHVIHCHQRRATLLVLCARRGLVDRPVVVEHAHNDVHGVRRLSFRADHVVAVGSAVQSMLVERFDVHPSRVSTIANWAPEPNSVSRALRSGPLQMLCVGRLVAQKDPLFAVELVAEMIKRNLDVELVWAGDGVLGPELRHRIDHLGIGHRVNLLGDRKDVEALMAQADALLLTSKWEGLPLVILEAMSMGLAVIYRDVGSCSDAVRHGVEGLRLGSSLTAKEAAAYLETQLGSAGRDRLQILGERGRRRHGEQYSEDSQVAKIEELYRTLLTTA